MCPSWHSEVLTTDDREQWTALVKAVPQRDVFFMPEYVVPFESLSEGQARLFFFGDETSYIVYPFFLRRIDELPFYQARPLAGAKTYFDVVSPYGYSGPLAFVQDESHTQDLWQDFLSAFADYCQETGIVCEFARLNPFVGNHRYLELFTDGVQASGEITYVDLTQSEDELWQGFNRGNRSNINKARRSGLEIERGRGPGRVQAFYQLYVDTMRRNRARSWYYFSPGFFEDSLDLLDDRASLFCACYRERVVAAASFLHAGEVMHYFLGGSDGDYLALRPNNLLMYQAILWAKHHGFRAFNLGGGYGSGDSLLRFKSGFSKLTACFYTYRAIHNAAVYAELCQRHRLYVEDKAERCDTGYFPRYRAEGTR